MMISLDTEAGRELMKHTRNLAIARGALQNNEPWSKEDLAVMDSALILSFVDEAWKMLDEQHKKAIADAAVKQTHRFIGDGMLKSRMKELLDHFVKLAVDAKELEVRKQIDAEVAARWEKLIEPLIEARVAAAVAKIKAEIAR